MSWSELEYFGKLVAKQPTCGLWLVCVFDITFVFGKGKGQILWQQYQHVLIFSCLFFHKSFGIIFN